MMMMIKTAVSSAGHNITQLLMMMMMNIKSSPPVNSVEILTIREDFCMEFYTAVKHWHILFTARFH